ncbi:acetyl-CoA hydrolase/transferase family protein [Tepidiforma sp.]|uniref:acetyl-CoA hydrolase/transferase family protein n=1 Tax=Tepidiforma sp. TaxID=2682230 RepID=UPI002ADDD298|nr:acetyl-CoA hydrolase/transferase C-terminal domain-containing protein [Tepidiforma sp.]
MAIRYRDWRDEYRSRQKSLAEAMEVIREGDLVGVTILCPAPLVQAFVERARQLGNVSVRTLAPNNPELFNPELFKGEREIELFIGDAMRPAHDAKIATYLPNTFMLGMKAFDNGREEARIPDVFLTPCSPPNEHGYVHFGPHMWQRKAYARRCKHTIAIVDPNITPVYGDVWMHVSEIETFVEGVMQPVNIPAMEERVRTLAKEEDRPALLEIMNKASPDQLALVEHTFHAFPPSLLSAALGIAEVDPAAQAIADNLRQIIRDGDTIQVGVGQPSQLMFLAGAFDDAEHLGVHTELGSPGLAKAWAKGIIDGSRKTLFPGKSVAVAWTGCDGEDLRIIANNPAFELYSPDQILNPAFMSQNHQMTSINSAIAVDLLGQIASEDRFGGHMVNGTGGQPDTHMAAAMCKNGRAITVMRSTAMEGTISKVVAKHEAGTLVTIPRYLADTIITEYGVARLLDKNHRQRAEELISIAHPDFRAELRREAQELWG